MLSALASRRSSSARACCCSRFSLRYLAPLLPFCLLVRRASVSFTCLATSSSLTSTFTSLARRLRSLAERFDAAWSLAAAARFCAPACRLSFLRLLPLLLLLPLGWLAALFTSTRSLPMRVRFLRWAAGCAACAPAAAVPPCAAALRSRRRSSFVFFLGRVVGLMALRSMVPSTLGPASSGLLRSLNTPSSSSPMALARSSTEGFTRWG